jgi:hypothetical protein
MAAQCNRLSDIGEDGLNHREGQQHPHRRVKSSHSESHLLSSLRTLVTNLSMWGAFSDYRAGLSFVIQSAKSIVWMLIIFTLYNTIHVQCSLGLSQPNGNGCTLDLRFHYVSRIPKWRSSAKARREFPRCCQFEVPPTCACVRVAGASGNRNGLRRKRTEQLHKSKRMKYEQNIYTHFFFR